MNFLKLFSNRKSVFNPLETRASACKTSSKNSGFRVQETWGVNTPVNFIGGIVRWSLLGTKKFGFFEHTDKRGCADGWGGGGKFYAILCGRLYTIKWDCISHERDYLLEVSMATPVIGFIITATGGRCCFWSRAKITAWGGCGKWAVVR